MSQSKLDPDRVVRLLLQDSIPTLGERAHGEVLRLAANYKELVREWMADGETPADAQRSFDRAVVDGLQQTAHDLRWDTTCPACPLHPRHPLWYNEDERVWFCRQTGAAIAPLGDLARLRPPAT
jgi:hypothetical protein